MNVHHLTAFSFQYFDLHTTQGHPMYIQFNSIQFNCIHNLYSLEHPLQLRSKEDSRVVAGDITSNAAEDGSWGNIAECSILPTVGHDPHAQCARHKQHGWLVSSACCVEARVEVGEGDRLRTGATYSVLSESCILNRGSTHPTTISFSSE